LKRLLTILNEVQRHVTKTLCDIWNLTNVLFN